MRNLSVILIMGFIVSLASAAVIDNFDSYAAGDSLSDVSLWLSKGAVTDQAIQDDGTGNLFYRSQSSSSFTRGATIDLGDAAVLDGESATLSFKVMVLPEVTREDVSIGLTDKPANDAFDDEWDSYGPYIAMKEGNINVRQPDGTFVSVSTTITGVWYDIQMDIDNSADTFDVYLDGVQVVDDNPFRKNPSTDLLSLKVHCGGGRTDQFVGFDDIAVNSDTANKPSPLFKATAVDIADQLSWSGPHGIIASGYDVYFGTEPNALNSGYDMEKIVDNQLVLTADPAMHTAITSDMDYLTTYYWQVDVYDSSTVPAVYPGDLWSFTTEPQDTAPTVTAGSSYLTWIDNLPQDVDVVVNDNGEGDISTVTWEVISGPGYAIAEDMQMVDRPNYLDRITGDPNLLRDWIGTDSRGVNEANSDVLTLTLSGLPEGTYNWKSYHYDPADQGDVFNVIVNDAAGSTATLDVIQTVGTDIPATFTTTITSDGSDVTLVFVAGDDQLGMFSMNGFELTGDGDPLMVDFTPQEEIYIAIGYQGYLAEHEIPESFTTQSFAAFGTMVSVTPTWDAPGAVITATGGTLPASAAVLDKTDAPKLAGTYTLQVTATDAAEQANTSILEVQVVSDACAAALQNGAVISFADLDGNCIVDLHDMAELASQWLNDIRLSASVPY